MSCSGLVFHEWATNQSLVRKSDLSELTGAQLAIDADDYVDRILTDSRTREPLLPALGGFPIAIKKHVNEHLTILSGLDITPRFVFNGLDVATRDRAAIAYEAQRTTASLAEAWNLYTLGQADAAVEEFGKSCAYRSHNLRKWLNQYLTRKACQSSLAPYSAAAQIVYWKQHGSSIHAMTGGLSLILFGAEKVITAIDWEAKTFTWTTGDMVRAKLGLTQDQTVDLCLLSGLTLLPALREIVDSPANKIDATKAALTRAGNDGIAAVMQAKMPESYLLLFKKAKTVVKHMPVVQIKGQIDLENGTEAFGNIHDCIGRRLPEEVLYYTTRGIIDPQFLNYRATMEVFEISPLDGGDSPAYHQLVQQSLLPMRRQALAMLSSRLHRYYHNQDVALVCWFDEPNSVNLGVPEAITSSPKAMEKWRVTDELLKQIPGFDKNSFEASPLRTLMHALQSEKFADQTKSERAQDRVVLRSCPEFIANATWRFLQGRGYINDSHRLTSWGKAYSVALEKAQENGYLDSAASLAEAEEALLIAIELIRLDVLNGSTMFGPPQYSGAPLRGTETDKTNTNLISRIACLGSFQHREMGFTGPLSRHLLAYQQIVSATRTTLRHLQEVFAIDMLLAGSFSRDTKPSQWAEYGARLPLINEPDLGLALLVKSYLDELSNEKRPDITRWFPQALDIHGDLKMAWKLWAAVNAGVQAAEEVASSSKAAFTSADEWLTKKLAQEPTPLTNGTS